LYHEHRNTNECDYDDDTDEEEPPEAPDMLEKQEAAPATKVRADCRHIVDLGFDCLVCWPLTPPRVCRD
jgi:hypothetical protein